MRTDTKQWVILLAVLAVLGAPSFLLPLWLNRDIPVDNLSSLEQHFARDAELRTRLAQAMEQERDGALDDARAGYLAAALSTNPSLRDAATKGLARVTIKKDDPVWLLMFRVQELATSTRHVLVVLVLGALAAWMLLSLIRLIPRRSGFSIGDFAVKGGTYVPETSAALALEFRQAVADSLSVIQLLHHNFAADLALLTEPLIVPGFGLPGADRDELAAALAGVVEVQVGSVGGVSLEKLLNLANVFRDRRRYVISGSLTKADGEFSAVAKMIDLRSGALVNQWEVRDSELPGNSMVAGPTASSADLHSSETPLRSETANEHHRDRVQITDNARILAIRLLFDLLRKQAPRLEAKSWRSFYYFTESLRLMKQYSAAVEDSPTREYALNSLYTLVYDIDHTQKLARFNLGLLYLNQGDGREASKEFAALLESMEAKPFLSISQAIRDLRQADLGASSSPPVRYLRKHYDNEILKAERHFSGGLLLRAARDCDDFPKMLQEVGASDLEDSAGADLEARIRRVQAGGYSSSLKAYATFPEIRVRLEKLQSPEPADRTAALEELKQILNEQQISQFYRTIQQVADRLSTYEIMHADIARMVSDEFAHEDLKQIIELINRIPLEKIDNLLKSLLVFWKDKQWAEARQMVDALEASTQVVNENEGNRRYSALIETTRLPLHIRLLARRNGAEFLRIHRWRESMRTPFYVQVLYHQARAAFQSFEFAQLLIAHREARRVCELLGPTPTLLLRRTYKDPLRGLALCLEVQAAILIFLARENMHATDPIFPPPTLDQLEETKLEQDMARYTLERVQDQELRQILLLSDDKSEDLRAVALETLGLWARYKRVQNVSFRGTPRNYFESALASRSWPNTQVFLAESLLAESHYHGDAKDAKQLVDEAKRLILLALKQCPNHRLAKNLEKRLNGKPAASAEMRQAMLSLEGNV